MAGWILKLILIWLVIRAIQRLVRGIADGLRGGAPAPPAVALVRDPVCGTFVLPTNAPSSGTGAQTRFFCSENCQRIYASSPSASDRRREAAVGGREPAARWGTKSGPRRAE